MQLELPESAEIARRIREAGAAWDARDSVLQAVQAGYDADSVTASELHEWLRLNMPALVEHRRDQLARLAMVSAGDSPQGRVLVMSPALNLADGLAGDAAGDLFSETNVPHPALWLAFIGSGRQDELDGGVLIAFMPEAVVSDAAAAIDANAEGCIAWVESEPWCDMDCVAQFMARAR